MKTPGVYIQEVPTLPPSVAEVSTAIPAFIGYVQTPGGPARIGSILEYQQAFGTAPPARFVARVPAIDAGAPIVLERTPDSAAETLYYAVSHYFANGGGPCWVVPLDGTTNALGDYQAALARAGAIDEPTLLLFPQAARLVMADYGTLAKAALDQCGALQDRFTILDVPRGDDPAAQVRLFRDAVTSTALAYGAAYHPYLDTTLPWVTDDDSVTVERSAAGTATFIRNFPSDGHGITITFAGPESSGIKVKIGGSGAGSDAATPPTFAFDGTTLTIGNVAGRTGAQLAAAWAEAADRPAGFTLDKEGDGTAVPSAATATTLTRQPSATLASLRTDATVLYNRVREAVGRERVTLPPSPAMAGIYAAVDRDRGVWKAPANIGLSATIGPVVRITDAVQEDLNVDANAGKSVNAIRAFAGRGTLVWGARTLAGNDNEWRYVPVRRLFITIEESTRKASAFAVFEPNDATTWLKVKGMIESYLYGLWERGALAGSKPDQAYYVHVGLGSTMTAQDVLEGRMIVEIGIAAVRPAEFVVLRFSHRLQQA